MERWRERCPDAANAVHSPLAHTWVLLPALPTLQAFRGEHPGLLEALASAAAAMTPANAAPLLTRLEAELPPTLTDVAPGGDCVLVAIAPGLVPLLGELPRGRRVQVTAGRWKRAVQGRAFLGGPVLVPARAAGTRAGLPYSAATCWRPLAGTSPLSLHGS